MKPRSPVEESPWPRLAGHLGKSLAAVVLLVLGAEGLALGLEYGAYGTTYDGDRPRGLYEPGPQPRFVPGVELNGWKHAIHINELAFRGPPPPEPVEGDLRLMCLGGSTTFDIHAPDDASTWPALLQERLGEQREGPVVVMNGGVPGEVLLPGFERLSELQPQVQADAVVVYHGPNDLASMAQQSLVKGEGEDLPLLDPIVADSIALIRGLRRAFPSLPERLPAWSTRKLNMADARRNMRHQLRAGLGWARELGLGVIWVTHPTRPPLDDSEDASWEALGVTTARLALDPARTLELFDIWNEEVHHAAEMHGGLVIEPSFERRHFGDSLHFSPEGSRAMAEQLAAALAAADPRVLEPPQGDFPAPQKADAPGPAGAHPPGPAGGHPGAHPPGPAGGAPPAPAPPR